PMIGRTFSHYSIVERLGAGGMGEVYKARDENLGREVAVKVLPVGTLVDEAARRRFRREAETLSRLNHPHIATIYDFHSADDIDYLVMEYVAGSTLAARLAVGALPEREVVSIGAGIAAALAEAHEQGLVHCDLKPANVMLTPKQQVKVLDFGISRLASRSPGLTATITALDLPAAGTLAYMAPEQVRGQSVDARTDVYAAGAVLYELATGSRPFPETQTARLVEAVLHDPLVPPSSLRPALSEGLERVILKCLERDPANRYQSAAELGLDVRRLESGSAELPDSSVVRRQGVSRRLVVAALLAVFGGLVAWSAWSWRRSAGPAADVAGVDSLIVLPSRVFGASADEFLTDAIPNSISAHLTQVPGLETKVPPTSIEMQRVQGDLARIGAVYGVTGFVQSTVAAESERLTLNVQLVHARTRRLLWSRDYQGSRDNYLALVREAAEGLRAELRPAAAPLVAAGRGAGQSEAELAFQRGLYFSQRYNHLHKREDLDRARAAFEMALDLDPSMADAAAEIGWLHLFEMESGAAVEGLLAGLEHWGRRAVQLDERCSRGWSLLTFGQSLLPDADPRLGLGYGLRAAAYGARDAMAHNALGGMLSTVAPTLALEAVRESARLDPLYLYPQLNASTLLCSLGRADEALGVVDSVLRIEPEMPLAQYSRGLLLIELGRAGEAQDMVARLRGLGAAGRLPPELVQTVEAGALIAAGQPDARQPALDRLYGLARDPSPVMETPPVMDAWLVRHGPRDRTIELLKSRSDRGRVPVPYDVLMLRPDFASLRDDPRFAPVVGRARERFDGAIAILREADARGELPAYVRTALDALLARLEVGTAARPGFSPDWLQALVISAPATQIVYGLGAVPLEGSKGPVTCGRPGSRAPGGAILASCRSPLR
ncbi:MAG TPA: protein kinase, partial [Vicinamibacterales bacterium]|nr:protein kinase [Vicinamibacterales bacterium]